MTRQAIGGAMILGIVGGILLDIWIQFGSRPFVYAQEPEPPREIRIEKLIDWTPERIYQEIKNKAEEYGVSASEMKRTLYCESQGSTTIQSYHRYTERNVPPGYTVGDREQSYGACQIHLPSHPSITKEQALDPAFCIDFMAKKFAEGKQKMWSCY